MDFNIILNSDITVKSLNVYANPFPIIPPESHICTKGTRQYSRFYYVTSGEIIFNKGTSKELHGFAGDIMYLPHDVTYASEWNGSTPGAFLTVNFILNSSDTVFSDDICLAVSDTDKSFLKLFNKLLSAWTKGSFNYRLEALSLFMELLSKIAVCISESEVRKSCSSIYIGIMYIENHFWEEFSVNSLAKMCSVSPATFRRKFKSYSNYSPITYRNFLRVRRAKELLESGEYTVTEAAGAVGFDDLSYFNRTFRKFLGCVPSFFSK